MNPASIETKISIIVTLPETVTQTILTTKKSTGVHYPNHGTTIPHITLYACRFEKEKYDQLVVALQTITVKPFEVTIGDLEFKKNDKNDDTFVSFDMVPSSELPELHQHVLAIANPLRGGLIRFKDLERFKKNLFSLTVQATIEQYGYQYVNEFFSSHITIGEIADNDTEMKALLTEKLHSIVGTKFIVDTIYVKYSEWSMPDEKQLFESELTAIPLHG